jgi:hypothetical protein
MNVIRAAALFAALGAFLALLLLRLGVVSAATIDLGPLNSYRADAAEVAANASGLAEAAPLSSGIGTSAADATAPTELLSIWRAADRAGVLVRGADGQTRQVRLNEAIGAYHLVRVGDGQAVFASPQGELTLRIRPQ